jgi:hypothetical protein
VVIYMSKTAWSFDVGRYEVPDMKRVRDYRAFIQDVIDGVILCYTPTFTPALKAIESRIKLLSNRIDSLNNYLCESTLWDRSLLNQRDATLAELKMLYADRERTQTMSDSVDRRAIDRNLHKLHRAAQYLFKWGYIEHYTITKGMIDGVWFDGYKEPERHTFSTLKWEVAYNEDSTFYRHEHITKTQAESERDKMFAQEERERMFHNPTPPSVVSNGDLQWDKNAIRVRPVAHQESAKTLIRRIRRKRKMPLFLETFKAWEK